MPARSLAGAAHAGLRAGSTSAAGGPEPRAVTRRPFFTDEHGEDRTRAAARWRGAEGGVDPARPSPVVTMKRQWRWFASQDGVDTTVVSPAAKSVSRLAGKFLCRYRNGHMQRDLVSASIRLQFPCK